MRETRVSVVGDVIGTLWWPIGAIGSKSVDMSTIVDRGDTLRAVILSLVDREGGDFSGAATLAPWSAVTIERVTYGRTIRRTARVYSADALPSIADLVADRGTLPEWPEEE